MMQAQQHLGKRLYKDHPENPLSRSGKIRCKQQPGEKNQECVPPAATPDGHYPVVGFTYGQSRTGG